MVAISRPVYYISFGAFIYGSASLLKDYLGGTTYSKNITANNKVVIITGANSGIGHEAAKCLAKRGAIVYMACKDMASCEERRKDIVLKSENKYVYCRKCDLSSFESIRSFVETFKSEQNRLDILINNAGIMRCPKGVTAEGIEMQLGVNHMGHFLLTNLLLDTIKKSAPSRIVVVSSAGHLKGKIHKDDLNMDKEYDPADAYNQSKLANLLFSNYLSLLLLDTKVTVNAVHPGICNTNITRYMGAGFQWSQWLFYPFFWPFIRNSYQGGQTLVHAALEPSLVNVTGKYFSSRKPEKTSEDAEDLELQKWMWEVSEKWTRLK